MGRFHLNNRRHRISLSGRAASAINVEDTARQTGELLFAKRLVDQYA
jgi:hypothetical protein